jgi:K+-sensing histidine kinase KdpD
MELQPEERSRLSDICHDLRGGTWVVRGFLELVNKNWSAYDDAKRQELVRMAFDNVERIERAAKELDEWRAPAGAGDQAAAEETLR